MLLADRPRWVKLLVTLGAAGAALLFAPLATRLHGVEAYTGLATAVAAVSAGFLPPLWALAGAALPLLLGAIGLPVLPGGNAGLGFFASGAGGYALAPLFFAGLGGLFLWLSWNEPRPGTFALGLFVALVASNLTGTLWLVGPGGYSWIETFRLGTLWMAVGDFFRSGIAFSVFFFYRRETRRRDVVRRQRSERRRRKEERYALLEALDREEKKPPEGGDVDGEEVERARRELKAREEEDLPPYFRL
ncbi:MAG TPA: biotin transporter BioY [bacterium]|nr:biotin transporter BioY [bacterium]